LPIGGSTFIKAATIDNSQVLFDVGAGVVTEKSSEDAIKNIDKRLEDLQKTQERLVEMMQNLQNEAAEISQKAQTLISEGKK
jgi:prefoldin alpha subunit